MESATKQEISILEFNKVKEERDIYKTLYESLLDFGQTIELPVKKLDYVKARVFDAWVSIKRINLPE
jgi:hypothetical protein